MLNARRLPPSNISCGCKFHTTKGRRLEGRYIKGREAQSILLSCHSFVRVPFCSLTSRFECDSRSGHEVQKDYIQTGQQQDYVAQWHQLTECERERTRCFPKAQWCLYSRNSTTSSLGM